MIVTFLGIGSNLGDRESFLSSAIRDLRQNGVEILKCASIYETEAKDIGDQPRFLNTVTQASTNLGPRELLELCLTIEEQHQRSRIKPKSSRTLDIDILFYADAIIREPGLTIPHPRLHERNFVLAPLAEIAPDFIDPRTGESVAELLRRCGDAAGIRLHH